MILSSNQSILSENDKQKWSDVLCKSKLRTYSLIEGIHVTLNLYRAHRPVCPVVMWYPATGGKNWTLPLDSRGG